MFPTGGTALASNQVGTAANRPAASAVPAGFLYYATDTNTLSESNGSTWTSIVAGGGGTTKSAVGTGNGGGNITTASTSFVNITGAAATIGAAVGDKLFCVCGIEDISDATAVPGYTLNFGASTGDVRGATSEIVVISGTGNSQALSFTWLYTAVAGDISGGNVTVQARVRVASGSGNASIRNGVLGIPVLVVVNEGPN